MSEIFFKKKKVYYIVLEDNGIKDSSIEERVRA